MPTDTKPSLTPWRYSDLRRHSHAEQFRKYVEFESFTRRDSLKSPHFFDRSHRRGFIALLTFAVLVGWAVWKVRG